jgi:hypothetical protein
MADPSRAKQGPGQRALAWQPRACLAAAVRNDTITVCAIVKDERVYLGEWVAYYRLLGADRLVLYSNDCADGTDRLLDAMQAAGLAEHRPWPSRPGVPAQQSAYADAIARAATSWIAFLDADEFLYLAEDATLQAYLARFGPDVAQIAINWRVFGSAGEERRRERPVIERFTRATPPHHAIDRHVKAIVRAEAVAEPGVHAHRLAHGLTVNGNGKAVELQRGAFTIIRRRYAQVNHYVVKSRAEFAEKRRRGIATVPPEAANKGTTRDGDFFAFHDRNEEEERAILRHLPALRREMGRVEAAVRTVAGREFDDVFRPAWPWWRRWLGR